MPFGNCLQDIMTIQTMHIYTYTRVTKQEVMKVMIQMQSYTYTYTNCSHIIQLVDCEIERGEMSRTEGYGGWKPALLLLQESTNQYLTPHNQCFSCFGDSFFSANSIIVFVRAIMAHICRDWILLSIPIATQISLPVNSQNCLLGYE